ncbi:hypothetical protein WJX74_008297 [Apatococcus lobatus]|uniref:LysM domain-containing protein n=2 Tax=Apatococcus TaxID=904362 RepID=A0AAW1SMR2_9CHLO
MEAALGYNEFGGGANPNAAPICNGGAGTPYSVTAPNGKSITVKILDKCQACDNDAPHIDLTAGAFQALGYDLSQGVIQGVVYGPAGSSPSGGSSGCQPYTVQSGDTCYAICTAHGQTEAQFDALNPGINCDDLQIGQQICA